MSAVVEAIGDAVEGIVKAVVDVVQFVWDEIAMPILEFVFGLFGIEDEDVVHVKSISQLIFTEEQADLYKKAVLRAALERGKDESTGFLSNFLIHTNEAASKIDGYYNYASRGGYTYGLPDMEISGASINTAAVLTALETATGVGKTVLTSRNSYPTATEYYKYDLQTTHGYAPGSNTLTFTDSFGNTESDWGFVSVDYIALADNYEVTISREALLAKFSMSGPDRVIEGLTTSPYTIKCDRTVPAGESVTINLLYSGTAIDGTDYTSVASVVMLANTDEIAFTLDTIDNLIADSSRAITVTIDSITNTNGAFEAVGVDGTQDEITTTITDEDTLILYASNIAVAEGAGTATVNVTLSEAALAPFTVNYVLNDITASGGPAPDDDYDNTGGTLEFLGTAGEVQSIVIPINSDLVNDDLEKFRVTLSNCSDPLIDTTQTSTVTIIDGSALDPTPGTTFIQDVITKVKYTPELSMIVTYHSTANPASDWYYWIEVQAGSPYTGLSTEAQQISGLEMLPVAILRQDTVNADIDTAAVWYTSTKTLLARLGLNIDDMISNLSASPDIAQVQDAFISFGINPLDTDPVISKILFLTYYQITVENVVTSSSGEYTATFTEQNVNKAAVWTDQAYEIISGSIGPVGTYTHQVSGTTLYMRNQLTVNTYAQITITSLNAFETIAVGGMWNMSTMVLGDENFSIPVSKFVVDHLTPIEQLTAFPLMLRFNMYAGEIQHLEWYETAAFWDLFDLVLTVVTIVVFVSSGFDIGTLAKSLARGWLLSQGVVALAKLTGNAELAAVLGVAAALYFSTGADVDTAGEVSDAFKTLEAVTMFADNVSMLYTMEAESINNDFSDVKAQYDKRMEEINSAVTKSQLDTAIVVSLKSPDTLFHTAITAQYDFSKSYDYTSRVGNYHTNALRVGVV